jgi:hypothetical protein
LEEDELLKEGEEVGGEEVEEEMEELVAERGCNGNCSLSKADRNNR